MNRSIFLNGDGHLLLYEICLLLGALLFSSCEDKPLAAHTAKPAPWVKFDSLLRNTSTVKYEPGKIFTHVQDTTFETAKAEVTRIGFAQADAEFYFHSQTFKDRDTTLAEMRFHNAPVRELFEETGGTIAVEVLAGLEVDADSVELLYSGPAGEMALLINGYYPQAYGKFAYIQKGVILHFIEGKCFGYLLSGDRHLPGNFYPVFDPDAHLIRYLKVQPDWDAIDRDVAETYTITPACIHLQEHTFSVEKNDRGETKEMVVKAKNYYENERVNVVRKNW